MLINENRIRYAEVRIVTHLFYLLETITSAGEIRVIFLCRRSWNLMLMCPECLFFFFIAQSSVVLNISIHHGFVHLVLAPQIAHAAQNEVVSQPLHALRTSQVEIILNRV